MRFIADLHIHSYLSRATSKDLTLEGLARWAQLKGITVVGTGDFTHPRWLAELREKLVPAEPGLYALRPDLERAVGDEVPAACRGPVRFMLQVEVSSIYKRGGKVRKVHNLVYAPDLEMAARIAARLGRIGNIESDGRPILGLDSRDLLEIVLEASGDAFLIPAHIWTPWFSALGAMSGFDAIDECFGDLAGHIFAVETGLSSDPAMNWRLSSLDRYALVSSSDAHSPEKLGREASRFDCELSYHGLRDSLRGRREGFLGTVEFFPEEGKYHLAGHRKCGVVLEPDAARAAGAMCPQCGKPATGGVMGRVEELADRDEGARPELARDFQKLIPLGELLGELLGAGPASKRVHEWYRRLLDRVGPELVVLGDAPSDVVGREGPPLVEEALRRMRAGQVEARAGYDGEYGVIRVFDEETRRKLLTQRSFRFVTAPGRDVEPIADAVAEPIADPVAEPIVDAVAEPIVDAVAEPIADAVAEPIADAVAEPIADAVAEPIADPLFSSAAGPVPEQTADLFAGETAEPRVNSIASPDPGTLLLAPSLLVPTSPAAADVAGYNDEQRRVIEHDGGPLLVVAGPGTGKTRTIVGRVAHLIAAGVSPRAITAISFTRKAAGELAERLEAELGEVGTRVAACTFHSLALELLRAHPGEAGLPRDFTILDEVARRALCPDAAVADAISRAKAGMVATEELEAELAAAHAAYQGALAAAGAIDFDDLVLIAVRLLETSEGARAAAHERCRYLFVDEFQDINPAQYRLVSLLAPGEPAPELCVVGDPDQAIYGFRGSDPRFFQRVADDHPGARVVELRVCHRCPAPVLGAAAALMSRSPGRAPRALEVRPADGPRAPVTCAVAATVEDEAAFIAGEIARAIGGTALETSSADQVTGPLAFHDIAVLYRIGAQAGPIEAALGRAGIPTCRAVDESPLASVEGAAVIEAVRAACAPGAPVRALGEILAAAAPSRAGAALRRARDQIAAMAAPFGDDVRGFLAALPFLSEAEARLETEKVALLTLHAAKGLEFSFVVIAGCEEGLLPLALPGKSFDVEEERRLLYVGMTRARERLILTRAGRRALFGRSAEMPASRFLAELPSDLIATRRASRPQRPRPAQQLALL